MMNQHEFEQTLVNLCTGNATKIDLIDIIAYAETLGVILEWDDPSFDIWEGEL